MGHVIRTPAGTYRANWRDVSGRQKAKTFRTKKEAAGFLAQVESAITRGAYVDPHAGRQMFGPYAEKWLSARATEKTTTARDASIMRVHVLPRWAETPIGRIDHSDVQQWVSDLAGRRSPATVATCFRTLKSVLSSAARDRLIGRNPCDGVRLPRIRRKDGDGSVITPTVLVQQLLPATPLRHRALVALVGGTGLRWGEAVGLRWDALDLDAARVSVRRVAVEVAGTVTTKPYPKSKAGRRTVPVPPFAVELLREHRERFGTGAAGDVFTNQAGGPLRRTLFRARVWRPALVEAGLLGEVREEEPGWVAVWQDRDGVTHTDRLDSRAAAVKHVARSAAGGLRFHDLRHSYATWLISQGVPVNDVQQVMGHENPSTTLGLYTHDSGRADETVRDAFADDPLTDEP